MKMSTSNSIRATSIVFVGLLVFVCSQDVVAPGWCSTYGGTCEIDPTGGTNELFKRTCPNNTEAVVPDFNIEPTCPEFADGPVCCDSIQYGELRDNIKKASAVFSRCPACIENFKRLWCAYTCHPDQSTFKKVLRTELSERLKVPVVADLAVDVSDTWATKFFDSCKSVVFPSTGDTVMETIFGAKSAYDFLEFQGRNATYGGQSPEMIYFSLTDTVHEDNSSIADLDILYDCHSPDEPRFQCACTDCLQSCSSDFVVGQQPPDDRDIKEVYATDLTLSWVYFGVLLAVIILVTAYPTVFGPVAGEKSKSYDEISADEELDNAIREASMIPTEQSQRSLLARIFYQIGLFDARHPYLVIALSLLFTAICSIGTYQLDLLTDPERLWVPSDAQVALDKAQFDEDFAPFYRIEQAFFKRDLSVEDNFDENGTLKDIWQLDIVHKMIEYQDAVEAVVVEYEGRNVTWQDVCYKPIPGQSCMVQSPLEYFNGQPEFYARDNPDLTQEIVENVFETCTKNIVSDNCRGALGAPTFPNLVFTAYPRNSENFSDASGFSITYLVDNHKAMRPLAAAWEAEVIKIMERGVPGLTMDYSVERALEDELSRDIAGDIVIIGLSYVIMFVYIGIALGRLRPKQNEQFHSCGARLRAIVSRLKFGLGFGGIMVVICALGISLGLCALFGVQATLIIAEVIPFLVLAIGIDNVFIIVSAFQSMNRRVDMDIRLAETLALVSTNVTLAAFAEVFAFFLGALTRMPAVQAFAVYSAVAILFDFFLQITMFSAILVLDAKREESGKADIFICVKVTEEAETFAGANRNGNANGSSYRPIVPSNAPTPKSMHAFGSDESSNSRSRGSNSIDKDGLLEEPMYIGFMKDFSRKYYLPFLLHRVTKVLVVLGFIAMLFVGIAYTSDRLELGLEQKVALPRDSHLQGYFTAIEEDMRTGPPLYFVVNGDAERLLNFSDYSDQNRICGLPGCAEDSLTGTVGLEALSPAITRIATASTSWLDDYISWLTNPADCCRKGTGNNPAIIGEGEYCPPPDQGPQIPVDEYEDPDTPNVCVPCVAEEDFTYNGTRVSVEDFDFYLEWFLASECSDRCGLCGTGHYEHVKLDENGRVEKARFMSFHDVLVTQKDFIDSMLEARRVSEQIAEDQNLDVYPYSIHYIFFDQYEFIGIVASMNSLYAGIAIIVLCLIILRNFWTSLLIVATVTMIIIDLLGFMALWDIQLNAVSVVNIVMAIGISVEFCVHIAVVFLRAKGSHDQRTRVAFIQIGSTVVQGIFATNLFPVFVLAFARSQLFEIYYFRMYLGIMLIAGAHGIVWTPVLLSILGPQQNAGWFYHSQDDPIEASEDEIRPLKRSIDDGNVNAVSDAPSSPPVHKVRS